MFDLRTDDTDSADYFAAISGALDLIAEKDARRMNRIKKDLQLIVILEKDGAAFWPDLRACILPPRNIESGVTKIALSIVHEATHARLRACGIPYSLELRERVETLCVEEEIDFARLLPEGTALIDGLRKRLETPWWSDSDLFEREMNFFRRVGAPQWLINRVRRRSAAHRR